MSVTTHRVEHRVEVRPVAVMACLVPLKPLKPLKKLSGCGHVAAPLPDVVASRRGCLVAQAARKWGRKAHGRSGSHG